MQINQYAPIALVMKVFRLSGRCLKKYLAISCHVTADAEFKVLDTVLDKQDIKIHILITVA